MTVSVADIDRWDAGDVREVFHATRSRAEAAFEASNGIAELPAFGSWGGEASEAAKESIGQTRKDLDAHGNEALAVAQAASQAADDVDEVKGKLATLRSEAESLGMIVDPVTNTIEPGPGAAGADPMEITLKQMQLQPRLDAILAEAATVDTELAAAINMATGAAPIPDTGPPVGPEGLTPTQVASEANKNRLEQQRTTTQARVDALQRRFDDLARQAYMGDTSITTRSEMESLATQLNDSKRYLGDLNAVHDALGKAPETYLTMFDPRTGSGDPVLAAIAVGNPDTASKVSVTVPGVGSTTKDSLSSMVGEANDLRRTTQLQMDRLGIPGSVATVAWMGYDTPPNPIDTLSPADLWTTMTDDQAQVGASSLSSYLEQLGTTSPDAEVTLLGHSYGSLTSSLALQDLAAQGLHPVDNVVFYGSPGLSLTDPAQLGLGEGNAFVMQAPGDQITGIVAPLAPLHGWGADPYAGILPELSSQGGIDPGGVLREGVSSHADYPRAVDGNLRMSGYNLAAVIAGLPDDQLVMAPTPPAVPLIPHVPPGGQIPIPRPTPGG